MSKIRREDNMSRTRNTKIERNLHLPLKSYSPWSHAYNVYNQPSHEMKCDSTLIILYSLGSKRLKKLYKMDYQVTKNNKVK